jgi:glycosyltransferase involved in cell wall biosynthesis
VRARIGWACVRVLIFHGYLLVGTGSNVYNARLAEALVGLGHEVHLLSQDRHPEEQPFVDAVGDWDDGTLRVRELHSAELHSAERHSPERARAPAGSDADVGLGSQDASNAGSTGRCVVYRPNIGGLLPVYVADRYEGIEARTFAQCSEEEIARYLDANVAAVRELVERVRPQAALANHLVMGPAILARGLGGEVPYAVKIHGSALEYAVKPNPERFLAAAREGLAGASGILVGSRHTAASLWEALGDRELPARTRLGPPGVDVRRFAPREPAEAAAGVRGLAERLRAAGRGGGPERQESAFARDELAAAVALERLDPERDLLVAYVGKLIVSKGVDLLLAAWPLVLERVPQARLVVVGFGAYRDGLERLCAALAAGEVEGAREVALAGRALEKESAPAHPLRHLLAFLEGLRGAERQRYVAAASALGERVVFTGRLEHEELAELLPACRALVVPSTFPEAFGMVAAEAAACGALPVSAAHSGLLEVSEELARAVPDGAAASLSFPVDDGAVAALAQRVVDWLQLAPELRARARAGLVSTVRERWSWDRVARGVIAAAHGELDGLQEP